VCCVFTGLTLADREAARQEISRMSQSAGAGTFRLRYPVALAL
jgi:hypothetical protein